MRDLFEVRTSTGGHPVRLSDAPLAEVVAGIGGQVVIADRFFAGQFDATVWIDTVEESKDLARMPATIEACRRAGLTRDGSIVAVGGGVVQDIACFVASTYMRGVAWSYVPTTLLAMVDSCIGGKSSINVGEFKNLVGTFYPPTEVVIAPAALSTLPDIHLAAGKAEAAKIAFARSREVFDEFLGLDSADDAALIALSLGAKKWFVETDEFDRAERLLLNFGHSFGHALESCTDYAVPHGVAVGVGCLAAVEMSGAHAPRAGALRQHMHAILDPLGTLPEALGKVGRDAFFRYWGSDKKHSAARYRPILLDENALLYRADLPREPATDDRIWAAFEAARVQLTSKE